MRIKKSSITYCKDTKMFYIDPKIFWFRSTKYNDCINVIDTLNAHYLDVGNVINLIVSSLPKKTSKTKVGAIKRDLRQTYEFAVVIQLLKKDSDRKALLSTLIWLSDYKEVQELSINIDANIE